MTKYVILIVIALFIYLTKPEKDYTDKIDKIELIAENNNYNTEYAILVDYSLHSGRNRLFVYNLKTGKIEKKYLVAHGEGANSSLSVPNFSNKVGSLASSKGIGVLGGRDYSGWGINVKYWIDGLDDTNDNMRRRVVVLHSSKWISSFETYPLPSIQSQGCFTVSNKTMKELDKFIQEQDNKKILIYTFK